MGVSTTVTVSCDYDGGNAGQHCLSVVQWGIEEAKAGKPVPPEAKEFVSFEMNGVKLAFCSQLHAAKFFLPKGYDILAHKVVEFPNNGKEAE